MADSKKNLVNIAMIKPQYIATDEISSKSDQKQEEGEDGETPDKKAKLDSNDTNNDPFRRHKNKKFVKNPRFRGREKTSIYENLCKTLIDVPVSEPMPVCESLRCRYLHDVNKFLQSKPPDIGNECHVFQTRGHCPRGISCRFGSQHITENGRNLVDESIKVQYEKNVPKTLTFYTKELENDLRKRSYDFKKSEEILDILPKSKPLPPVPQFGLFNGPVWESNEIDFTEDIDVPTPPPTTEIPPLIEEAIGPCPDDDLFKLHLAEKKKIDWRDKLYLAPLNNFGNLPFRRICKELGADVTCSETVAANSLLQSQPFEWLLTKRHETENLFGIQLFGNNPYAMTKCAQLLEENTNISFIDVNVGSPGDTIIRSRGTNHIKREKVMETIVRCVSRVSSLPITVSTRLGDYSEEKIASKFLPNYKACEISLVTVQGRNRETKQIDWDYVNDLSQKLSPVRVFGLSDVISSRDYLQIKEDYRNVSGALIGRGALVKPWLFTEVKQQKDWDISSRERLDILKRFVNYGLEHWGSDTKGVELTRRFLLDWLSFLCRYIPVGLLEQPPQKLHDKSPKFIGRDDIETLLGSQNPSDWIKISEMFLGPYPENYQFIPRIKSNLWPIDS
ncbi:hypothetical protein RUM44_001990 [Polyplax serrata]|uniref:tRNA-dihydrouridine(47) synthase [NAD(P)(+)] n=1 Tax=Polyplax serrata TaxID=468196 RepID=A0ABR1ALM2_POLSC